jgi:predicted ester cyclase
MKKLSVLLPFIVFVAISCQDKQAMAELDKLKAKAELEEQNKAIIQSYWDGKWNERRPEILDELLSENVMHHGSADEINGVEEYKKVYNTYLSAMMNTRFEIQELIAEGDLVMSRAICYATYNGSLGDIFPVGEEISFRFFTVFKLIDGRIVEEWELFQ